MLVGVAAANCHADYRHFNQLLGVLLRMAFTVLLVLSVFDFRASVGVQ